MEKNVKKILSGSLAGVMTLTGAVGALSTVEVQSVQASTNNIKKLDAKISQVVSSLKKNYLGLKNVGQWQKYIKECKDLLAKIPSGSTKNKYAETISKAEALINAAARVNQVEKSMSSNSHSMKNVDTWEQYVELAKKDLTKVDQKEFKKQIEELKERTAVKVLLMDKVKVAHFEAVKKVEAIVKEAEALVKTDKTKALEKYKEARNAGEKLSSHSSKTNLLNNIGKGIVGVIGDAGIKGDKTGFIDFKDVNSLVAIKDAKVSNGVIGKNVSLNLGSSAIEFENVKASKKTNVTVNVESGAKIKGGHFDVLTINMANKRSMARSTPVVGLEGVTANKVVVSDGVNVNVNNSSNINGVYVDGNQANIDGGVIKDTVAPTLKVGKGSNANKLRVEFSENIATKSQSGGFVELNDGDFASAMSFKVVDKAGKDVEGAIASMSYKKIAGNEVARVDIDFAKDKIVDGCKLIFAGEIFDLSGNKLTAAQGGVIGEYTKNSWDRKSGVDDKGILDLINKSTKDTIQKIIEDNAEAIGLDMVDYNTLSDEGKKAVCMEVYEELEDERDEEDGKPSKPNPEKPNPDKPNPPTDGSNQGGKSLTRDSDDDDDDDDEDEDEDDDMIGFESLEDVKEEFEEAVEEQIEKEGQGDLKTLLEDINKAADAESLGKLIIANGNSVDFDIDDYEDLSEEKRAAVFESLLKKKPEGGFKSLEKIEDILDDLL
ncbi:MAG: hypothetical protein RR539_09980 [Clostridium sp.]|uniref:hypothetical protein n=1 Tax=Clostridium sp. TaxID=1506 RepID=UPI002FCBF13C